MNRKAVASRIGFLVGCRTSVTCILAMFGVIDPVSIEGLVRQGVGTLVVIFIIGICFAAAQGYERDQVRLFLVSYRWALVFDVAFLVATSDFTFRLSAWYVAVCALRTWVRLFFAVLTVPEKSAERAIVEVQNIAPPGTQFLVISEFFVEWALFPGWKLPSSLSVCGLIFALFGEGLLLFGLSKEQKKWKKKQKEEGDTPQIKITCANNWLIGECGCQVMLCNPISFVFYLFTFWIGMYIEIDIRNKRDSVGAAVECEARYKGPLGSFRVTDPLGKARKVSSENSDNNALPTDVLSDRL